MKEQYNEEEHKINKIIPVMMMIFKVTTMMRKMKNPRITTNQMRNKNKEEIF